MNFSKILVAELGLYIVNVSLTMLARLMVECWRSSCQLSDQNMTKIEINALDQLSLTSRFQFQFFCQMTLVSLDGFQKTLMCKSYLMQIIRGYGFASFAVFYAEKLK